jgi:hypothetical protein
MMPTINALQIEADGTVKVIDLKTGLGIDQLLSIVGDFDATFGRYGSVYVYEWSLHENPLNPVATKLWWTLTPEAFGGAPFHGTIVLTGPPDITGNDTNISLPAIDLANRIASDPPTAAEVALYNERGDAWRTQTRQFWIAHAKTATKPTDAVDIRAGQTTFDQREKGN